MTKGKPRHNPQKPANTYGAHCPSYEVYCDGRIGCEQYDIPGDRLKCGGNRHNCVKVRNQNYAIAKGRKTEFND